MNSKQLTIDTPPQSILDRGGSSLDIIVKYDHVTHGGIAYLDIIDVSLVGTELLSYLYATEGPDCIRISNAVILQRSTTGMKNQYEYVIGVTFDTDIEGYNRVQNIRFNMVL